MGVNLSSTDLVAAAVLAAIKAYFLGKYGIYPWNDNDGVGYIALAEQLAGGMAWVSVPDLNTSYMPISLLRLPGYPLLVLASKAIAGTAWIPFLVTGQLVLSFVASYVLYRVVSTISGMRIFGLLCAVIFAVSYQAYFERFILTDSLYASVFTLIICYAALHSYTGKQVGTVAVAAIGLTLGLLFLMREATIVLAFGLAPLLILAVSNGERGAKHWAKSLTLAFAPLVITVAAVLIWNVARIGKPVITTGAQLVLTLTLVIVHERGTTIFDDNSLFDEVARQRVDPGPAVRAIDIGRSFQETVAINQDLFQRYKMTSPEIALAAQKKYFFTWLKHPGSMLGYTNTGISDAFLLLYSPFIERLLEPESQEKYREWCKAAFKLASIYLPLFWLVAAISNRVRGRSYLVASLAILIWVTVVSYAALHLEIRYLLPILAPVFLVLAISVGATVELAASQRNAGTSSLRPIVQHRK
jgi:hypothetical protein